jgi:sugar-specific transcriptional regulator TrmB
MKLTKQQAYSSLKNLQEKGIVKTTPERPALYYALPFENVVENFFTRKLNEIQHIRQSKQELMDNWKSTSP